MKTDDALSPEFFAEREEELRGRVGKRRFAHCQGVAETAAQLAEVYGVDVDAARLAGLLHDWDKGYDDPGILARVEELDMDVDPELLEMPRLLHGLTAASGLSRDYPQIPADVIQAVCRHTLGAPDMSELDMIIYIADALEPHRSGQRTDELRAMIGQVGLHELFLETYAYLVAQMLERRKKIYSKTVDTWNAYMMKEGDFCRGFAADAMPGD